MGKAGHPFKHRGSEALGALPQEARDHGPDLACLGRGHPRGQGSPDTMPVGRPGGCWSGCLVNPMHQGEAHAARRELVPEHQPFLEASLSQPG